MPKLSGPQVAKLAHDVGLRGDRLVTAVAVAKGESSWNSDAVGDTHLTNSTWGPSLGLWQIRSLKAQTGTGLARDKTRLKDPAFNAKSMAIISNQGTNWRPWTVYTSGAYRKYMDEARAAVAAMSGDAWSPTNPTGSPREAVGNVLEGNDDPWSPTNPTGSPQAALSSVLGIPNLDTKQIGWFLLGTIAVILGLVLIFKDVGAEVTGSVIKEALGT